MINRMPIFLYLLDKEFFNSIPFFTQNCLRCIMLHMRKVYILYGLNGFNSLSIYYPL